MFNLRFGLGLGNSTNAVLGDKCDTPVIASGLDADPTGEYTEQQTISYGGANDITMGEGLPADATILVRTKVNNSEGDGEWSAWAEWVEAV